MSRTNNKTNKVDEFLEGYIKALDDVGCYDLSLFDEDFEDEEIDESINNDNKSDSKDSCKVIDDIFYLKYICNHWTRYNDPSHTLYNHIDDDLKRIEIGIGFIRSKIDDIRFIDKYSITKGESDSYQYLDCARYLKNRITQSIDIISNVKKSKTDGVCKEILNKSTISIIDELTYGLLLLEYNMKIVGCTEHKYLSYNHSSEGELKIVDRYLKITLLKCGYRGKETASNYIMKIFNSIRNINISNVSLDEVTKIILSNENNIKVIFSYMYHQQLHHKQMRADYVLYGYIIDLLMEIDIYNMNSLSKQRLALDSEDCSDNANIRLLSKFSKVQNLIKRRMMKEEQ